MPYQKGQKMTIMIMNVLVPVPVMMVPMLVVSKTGYGGATGYLAVVTTLIFINLLLSKWQKRIIPRRMAKYEFVEG